MMRPEPMSVRATKWQAPSAADPAFRRYMEKEFLGGQVPGQFLTSEETDRGTDRVNTVRARTNAGFWNAMRRVFFAEPKRAHVAPVPGRH